MVLLTALATVVLCNLGAWWLLAAFPANRGYAVIEEKWRLLEELRGPVDILIVGDSSCLLAVDPQIIEEQTGLAALNLCTTGKFILLDDYWMLDRHISRHGPPRALILGHVYDIWRRSLSAVALAKIPMEWPFWRRHMPPLDMRLKDRIEFLLTKYVPLYADNISLSKNLMRPWLMGAQDFRFPPSGFKGLDRANPERVHDNMKQHLKLVSKERFEISPENRFALNQIAGLGKQHGFEIYIVNAPMYEGLFVDARVQAYLAELEAFFQRFVGQHPHIHHIFAKPLLFPDTVMENADHVTLPAADFYTRALVDAFMTLRAAGQE